MRLIDELPYILRIQMTSSIPFLQEDYHPERQTLIPLGQYNCLIHLQTIPLKCWADYGYVWPARWPALYNDGAIRYYIVRMGLRQQWRQFKQMLSRMANSKFFKIVRRLIFEQSHLSAYLPIMKEQMPAKIARIYGDRSYKEEPRIKDNHPEHRKVKKDSFLSEFFFGSKQSLDPMKGSLLVWYALVCFCTIALYVITGMAVVYGQQAYNDLCIDPTAIAVSIFCILIFLGDILVQLNTGYLMRGMIVVDRERAVRRYFRSLFVVDVLLVLIKVIAMATEQNYMNVALLPVVVIKFLRVFDLDRFFMRALSTTLNKKAVYVIGKQLVTIFLIAHTFGIIFYAMDYAYTLSPMCIDNPQLCWLNSSVAYSPIISLQWRLRYFYSLYWGIDTISTISYGDVAPNNPPESAFVTFCFCCSFLTYGYVVNGIIQIMLEARDSRDNFRQELIIHTIYMEIIAVSKPNQYDFRDQLESRYLQLGDREHGLEEEMKSRLPVELREQLFKSAFHKMYIGLQDMLFGSPSAVKLLYFLHERTLTKDETILEQGAPLTQLLYLQKGQIKLSCTKYQNTYPIITMSTPGEFIALYEFFLNERGVFTVKTAATSTLYFLNREEMMEQVGKYTDLRENWKLVRDDLRDGCNYQRISYCCYFCGSNHHWYRCMNVFPNFSNFTLRSEVIPVDRSRIALCRTHIWKYAKGVREVGRARVQDAVLRKIEERVASLRAIKEIWRKEFTVDIHHEWQYYKPAQNLSKLKDQWNPKKQKKMPLDLFQQPVTHLPFAFLPSSLF